MDKEELKIKVKEILESMGYTDIEFSNGEESLLVVSFNAKELTSFIAELPGWNYTGIQLDTTRKHQYKIELRKE